MPERRGLIIVHTGTGKGKTTAALGMGLRAWGQGFRVLVIQFIKGTWASGELRAAAKLGPDYVIQPAGHGFVPAGQDNEVPADHRLAAAKALQAAHREMETGKWDMIILDELNYAITLGLVPLAAVLDLLDRKPPGLHLVLTGRDARPAVIERADLVTEMKEIKHPFHQGIPAQKGVEF